MKRFSIIGLLLLWAILAQGQTLTIRDLHSRLPLEGVVLISEVPPVYAVTNAHGQAGISAFRGAETIQVRSLGYVTLELSYRQMQDSGFVLHLVPSALDLDQVVVSATRWSQASRNVPSRILSISPREVALQNPQTAADMLGITGKVFIQKSQQGGGSPMIRGFAANRLLYTVDGVRMNTAIFRGGNVQNVINLDPFAIEKTETLFGPGSVIYGSDAIGGVMSFQTLTPQLSLDDQPLISGKAITRYSSANQERTGHLNFNIGWKRWALVTSFSSWDYDHLRQGSHGPQEYLKKVYAQRQDSLDVVITQDDPLLQIPSAYAQVNLMQKVRYSPDAHWDLQYGFHYSTTSSYGRYDRHNRYRNGTLRYAEWDYGPQRWMMHHFSLAHQGKSIWYDRLSLRLAKQSFEESRIDRSFNSPERNTQKEEVEAWSVNLDLSRQAGSRNTLFYGMEYVYNTVASHGLLSDIVQGTAQAGPSRYPSSEWRSLAAYLSHELRLSTHLTLQGGLRYNHYSLDADFNNNAPYYLFPFTSATLSKGAITGSLGAVYRPSGAWAFRANLGTAFRSPNVDDVGKVFDSEPGTVTVPNPGLKAEYAWNADLGVVRVLGDAVKLDFTGYYTVLQDALVRRDYLLNGQDSIPYFGEMSKVQAIQNAAVAYVYGLQAGVEVRLPAGFAILADLNLQRGEEELDDGTTSPSRHAAPWFGVSRLRYRHNGLSLELNVQCQGEKSHANLPQEERGKDEIYAQDAEGNNYAPSWYTLNLKAMVQLNETFSLSGGMENLTDQRYRPYSSGISGAGRNFILSLKADF